MADRNSVSERPFLGWYDPDPCSNPRDNDPLGDLLARRPDRRELLRSLAVLSAGTVLTSGAGSKSHACEPPAEGSTLTFAEARHGFDREAHVAPDHELQVLLRWGDPVKGAKGDFVPEKLTAKEQNRRFGYNCDFIAFLPLPFGSQESTRGLLCVNHEYANTNLMLPGLTTQGALENLSAESVDIELAALGHSVVEVERVGDAWRTVADGPYNRRISPLNTEIGVSGPAMGHPRMRTSADPTGLKILGTLSNCGGGLTPWGTLLICEENFDVYFGGDPDRTPEAASLKRYGVTGKSLFNPAWAKHHARFDLQREPNEPNRFGWVVEFDPLDPISVPVKRTALGRLKHEAACVLLNCDNRIVVYSGDDERFEYLYKFVSRLAYDPKRPTAERNFLDDGTLHAARLDADGTLTWLPLVHGQGPLTAANGFRDQGDVVIEARRAADLLGATPLDRPEDVEISPVDGKAYVILTNNAKRAPNQVDAANPRPKNLHGHILELSPPKVHDQVDHAAVRCEWRIFMRCGDPKKPADGALCHTDVSANGWLSCPDNGVFDRRGRLWLATDSPQKETGMADGVYACDVTGPGKALTRLFFVGPRGAEVAGLCFTPDNKTLFLSVQHPGEEPGSHFTAPSTRWPDFDERLPPRPAVVAITRRDGRVIGT